MLGAIGRARSSGDHVVIADKERLAGRPHRAEVGNDVAPGVFLQQEAVVHAGSSLPSNDVAAGSDAGEAREGCARDVDGGELAPAQQVTVAFAVDAPVTSDDVSAGVGPVAFVKPDAPG